MENPKQQQPTVTAAEYVLGLRMSFDSLVKGITENILQLEAVNKSLSARVVELEMKIAEKPVEIADDGK
jgi:hypothetical protein